MKVNFICTREETEFNTQTEFNRLDNEYEYDCEYLH